MGYREDIKANFDLTIPTVQGAIAEQFIEDSLIDKALDRLLQTKQNEFQNRYRAAFEAYKAKYPEKSEMEITLDDLEEVDKGIAENGRDVMSYEQGTLSGKVRDAKAKIENFLEQRLIV